MTVSVLISQNERNSGTFLPEKEKKKKIKNLKKDYNMTVSLSAKELSSKIKEVTSKVDEAIEPHIKLALLIELEELWSAKLHRARVKNIAEELHKVPALKPLYLDSLFKSLRQGPPNSSSAAVSQTGHIAAGPQEHQSKASSSSSFKGPRPCRCP